MGKLQDGLLKQAKNEQAFRKGIIKEMAFLLRSSKTPKSLKIFILIVFIAAFGISCILTVMIIDALSSLAQGNSFEPKEYLYIILALVLIPMILAIPLVLKANSTEASLRLEERLDRTYESKYKLA